MKCAHPYIDMFCARHSRLRAFPACRSHVNGPEDRRHQGAHLQPLCLILCVVYCMYSTHHGSSWFRLQSKTDLPCHGLHAWKTAADVNDITVANAVTDCFEGNQQTTAVGDCCLCMCACCRRPSLAPRQAFPCGCKQDQQQRS